MRINKGVSSREMMITVIIKDYHNNCFCHHHILSHQHNIIIFVVINFSLSLVRTSAPPTQFSLADYQVDFEHNYYCDDGDDFDHDNFNVDDFNGDFINLADYQVDFDRDYCDDGCEFDHNNSNVDDFDGDFYQPRRLSS